MLLRGWLICGPRGVRHRFACLSIRCSILLSEHWAHGGIRKVWGCPIWRRAWKPSAKASSPHDRKLDCRPCANH